jgi:hypothetical protein
MRKKKKQKGEKQPEGKKHRAANNTDLILLEVSIDSQTFGE